MKLAFYDEDPNSRTFKYDLHKMIREARSLILSAINTLLLHWQAKGFPDGETPFTSYPDWARIVGGIMNACELGDPCQPFKSAFDIGGDLKDRAMRRLFAACFEWQPNEWLSKDDIFGFNMRRQSEGDEDLGWFGPLSIVDHANRKRLGIALRAYKGRILGGIRLAIDSSASHSERHRLRFVAN